MCSLSSPSTSTIRKVPTSVSELPPSSTTSLNSSVRSTKSGMCSLSTLSMSYMCSLRMESFRTSSSGGMLSGKEIVDGGAATAEVAENAKRIGRVATTRKARPAFIMTSWCLLIRFDSFLSRSGRCVLKMAPSYHLLLAPKMQMAVANTATESGGTQKSSDECRTPDWNSNFVGSLLCSHDLTQSRPGDPSRTWLPDFECRGGAFGGDFWPGTVDRRGAL
mmetsp:Transcript_3401/g.9662  ORF Transcript_3401/g.9662 Transcript_3401/m.9662 type:complete len:220 (+) Transcript_3401:933-1592(+)